jgi:tetratricopeptide (TPR) repeat protein
MNKNAQPDNLVNQGFKLMQTGKNRDAKNKFEQALQIDPHHFDALQLLGLLLGQNKEYAECIKFLSQAIKIRPNHTVTLNNLGNALKELNFFKEAIVYYDRAITLQPDYAEAYNNRGLVLKELNHFEDAIKNYEKTITLQPNNAEAYNNLGVLLMELLFLDEAIGILNKAISIKNHYANAHWNLSLCYLLKGNLKDGFREYEWRWESNGLQSSRRNYQIPLWLGEEPLLGKTILIYGEQGLGDYIQFSRYIELVARLGARVVLEVPSPLFKLMSNLKGVSILVIAGEELPHVEYQCPMMSLPLAFKSELTNIPAKIPYLSITEVKKDYWLGRKVTNHYKVEH